MLGFEGGVRSTYAERALTVTLTLPGAPQRERIWRQAMGDAEIDDLATVGRRYHIPAGYIRQAGAVAVAHAALKGRTTVSVDDVHLATRSLNRQLLDTLATRVETTGSWSDLVVNDSTASKLRALEQRCHYREELLDSLGPAFQSNANRGVRALFSGSSGVGKTLAARILASVLNMDLYRVDLSSIVNKYIGETEKNLHRVLSRAEELDVLLLLDEGDSLLGARTDVKSANDRYANLETNYLLQRLESYQGVVVVTTNASQLIDKAFQRRLDVIVHFVPPSAAERLSIMRLHLPAETDLTDEELADVCRRCSLTGGQIRNAALGATLLAMAEGTSVGLRHLEGAIETEYRKAGALSPLLQDGGTQQHHGGVEAFVRGLTGGARGARGA
jgi:SpoVK/Ycf46/Vps4 family AAA+-type ATPase